MLRGAWLSILMPATESDAALSALSVRVPDAAWSMPSWSSSWSLGQFCTPENASAQVNSTVTAESNHPAALGLVRLMASTSGAVRSMASDGPLVSSERFRRRRP